MPIKNIFFKETKNEKIKYKNIIKFKKEIIDNLRLLLQENFNEIDKTNDEKEKEKLKIYSEGIEKSISVINSIDVYKN